MAPLYIRLGIDAVAVIYDVAVADTDPASAISPHTGAYPRPATDPPDAGIDPPPDAGPDHPGAEKVARAGRSPHNGSMQLLRPIIATCICSALLATEAWAHPPPFFWMTDLSPDRRIGMDLSVGNSEVGVDALPVLAADVYADLSLTDSLTLVGRIPFVYARYAPLNDPDATTSDTALGNAGVGVAIEQGTENYRSAVHYGLEGYVHLPTANASPVLVSAQSLHTPDRGRYLPNATTLRLRGSTRYETESIFFQGELGLEHHLIDAASDSTDLLVGLGAGIAISPYVAFLGELNLITELLDTDDDRALLPVIDLGMRYHNPGLLMGVRVHVPLAEAYRNADVLAVALDLGFRF